MFTNVKFFAEFVRFQLLGCAELKIFTCVTFFKNFVEFVSFYQFLIGMSQILHLCIFHSMLCLCLSSLCYICVLCLNSSADLDVTCGVQ